MNTEKIFKKYENYTHKTKGNGSYISIYVLKDIISDIYSNGFIVYGYEFLVIKEISTQPFMDYSIRKKEGYKLNELLNGIDLLKIKLNKLDFNMNEIYFSILT